MSLLRKQTSKRHGPHPRTRASPTPSNHYNRPYGIWNGTEHVEITGEGVVDRWAVGKWYNLSNYRIQRANSSAMRLYTSQGKPSLLTKVPSQTVIGGGGVRGAVSNSIHRSGAKSFILTCSSHLKIKGNFSLLSQITVKCLHEAKTGDRGLDHRLAEFDNGTYDLLVAVFRLER